ncbi:hypothetical protein M662_10290 [Bacillus sp. SB49]|nr:hypothetical protein M662_10290 [Bacillus sp. SB49]
MGAYWFSGYVKRAKGPPEQEEWAVNQAKFTKNRTGPLSYRQLDVKDFLITPGRVRIDREERIETSSSPYATAESYIKRGCTLLLTQHLVTSLRHYKVQYEQFLKKLRKLPVNFMVLPVVPVKLLRPEVIRFFSRKGSPFLCIRIKSREELLDVCWEWIVQAQSYRRMPLSLMVEEGRDASNFYEELWSSLTRQYGMIKLTDISDGEEVSVQNLRDSGIYPLRGDLLSGGSADYNLYYRKSVQTFDDDDDFRYHDSVPDVTVMNGSVVQVQQNIVPHTPGTHIKVKIHKHFV